MSDTAESRRDGHRAITPKKPTIANKVLEILHDRELTAEEIAEISGISLNNARSRLTELKKKGSVETSGRRLSKTGIRTSIWKIRKDDKNVF